MKNLSLTMFYYSLDILHYAFLLKIHLVVFYVGVDLQVIYTGDKFISINKMKGTTTVLYLFYFLLLPQQKCMLLYIGCILLGGSTV